MVNCLIDDFAPQRYTNPKKLSKLLFAIFTQKHIASSKPQYIATISSHNDTSGSNNPSGAPPVIGKCPAMGSSHCLGNNETDSIGLIQQQIDKSGNIGDVNSTVFLDISAIKIDLCGVT